MRTELHHEAVLDRSRLTLVGVDHDEARAWLARDGLPLDPGGEAGTTVSRETRRLELFDDLLLRRWVAQELEAAARCVVRERLVALSEPDCRAAVRRMRHVRDDLVATRHDRGEIAVTQARDLDRSGCVREKLTSPVAVADRPGTDARSVHRHLQERVERDDLVDLPPADVHVVGERVRELEGDRADVAPYASEVVEQVSSLEWEVGKKPGEGHHVHASILCRVGGGWTAEPLRLRAPAFRVEPPLTGTRARGRRNAWPGNGERLSKLVDQALDRKLPISRLAPLVLGDGAQRRPDPCEDALSLNLSQRGRRFDVEQCLHSRRRLLRVLPARPARPRDPELDLRNGQGDGACDPNRLTLHGLHSARHRRRAPRLGRADSRGDRSRRHAPRLRPFAPVRFQQLDEASSPPG